MRLLKWTEALLLVGGVVAIVWCALVVAEARLVERQARRWLQASAVHSSEATGSVPFGTTAPVVPGESGMPAAPGRFRASRAGASGEAVATVEPSAHHATTVSTGTPLADLSIPRVGMSAVVFHGSDARTLRVGLGHIENTALPGEVGNVAIAGHRDSFFRPLRNIAVGDEILMSTPRERLHYRVSGVLVVKSDDVSVLGPTSGSILTLITCYPFWFIGQAPDRFVVRATQVRASEQATSEIVPRTSGHGDPGVSSTGFERSGRGSATAARESAIPQRPADVLVREAVERFRQIYNDRSANRWATRAGRPLVFLTCAVRTNADRATATCQSVSSVEQEPLLWLFNLREEAGRWAIQDVTAQ